MIKYLDALNYLTYHIYKHSFAYERSYKSALLQIASIWLNLKTEFRVLTDKSSPITFGTLREKS